MGKKISFVKKHDGRSSKCILSNYSWRSLSRPRLSRINACLEVKIWSLPKHENLTTGKKYCGKEEKLLLRSNFSYFPQYFQYILTSRVQLHINLLNVVNRIIFFLNSANLICRGTDISKYLRESLGIRDNESGLYIVLNWQLAGIKYNITELRSTVKLQWLEHRWLVYRGWFEGNSSDWLRKQIFRDSLGKFSYFIMKMCVVSAH